MGFKAVIFVLLLFVISVSAQTEKFADLTPTSDHEFCLYDVNGNYRGCYIDSVDFRNSTFLSDSNKTYVVKINPTKYDVGFSGSYLISYIISLLPFILFILAIVAIVAIAMFIIFVLILRVRR